MLKKTLPLIIAILFIASSCVQPLTEDIYQESTQELEVQESIHELIYEPNEEESLSQPQGAPLAFLIEYPDMVLSGEFVEGVSLARIECWEAPFDRLWGLVDIHGNVLAEPIYYLISRVPNERAFIVISDNNLSGLMYIDGSWIAEPVYYDIWHLADDLLEFNKYGKWGIMDIQGTILIEPIFAAFENRARLGNVNGFMVAYDIYRDFLGEPGFNRTVNANDTVIFQYRVIDLDGNTIFQDENIYKITQGRGTSVQFRLHVREEGGIFYFPVIRPATQERVIFDPNGLYQGRALSLAPYDFAFDVISSAEAFEVFVLEDDFEIEWVPIP